MSQKTEIGNELVRSFVFFDHLDLVRVSDFEFVFSSHSVAFAVTAILVIWWRCRREHFLSLAR